MQKLFLLVFRFVSREVSGFDFPFREIFGETFN